MLFQFQPTSFKKVCCLFFNGVGANENPTKSGSGEPGSLEVNSSTLPNGFPTLEAISIPIGGGGGGEGSSKNLARVCSLLLKTLTLFTGQSCHFPYPIYAKTTNLISYFPIYDR